MPKLEKNIEEARKDEVNYFWITFLLGNFAIILSIMNIIFLGIGMILFAISLTKYIDMRYWDLIIRLEGKT